MNKTNFPLLTIGNAIVDVITQTTYEFLQQEEISKGTMNLVDESRSEHLYKSMKEKIELAGGSASNTAMAFAALGHEQGIAASYLGKVADDELGRVFTQSMQSRGVRYEVAPLVDSLPTARSMIFVTPDSDRSMNTYLGATIHLSPQDINAEFVTQAKIAYFEGYLWDSPSAKETLYKVAEIAHNHTTKVAISLSDPLCVDRFRTEFLQLMQDKTVDMVFCNKEEVLSLYQTDDFQSACSQLRQHIPFAIVTSGKEGSLAMRGDETANTPAAQIDKIIDTTGAGDCYAAGFLYGLINDMSLQECVELGGRTATYIIARMGASPQGSLQHLLD